jgi:hypothetical protein
MPLRTLSHFPSPVTSLGPGLAGRPGYACGARAFTPPMARDDMKATNSREAEEVILVTAVEMDRH